MKTTRVLRALLPLAVTLGVFWAISRRVDWVDAFAHIHADALRVLLPALAVWAAASLWVDAVSLVRSAGGTMRASLLAMARLGQKRTDEARQLFQQVPPTDPSYRAAQETLKKLTQH